MSPLVLHAPLHQNRGHITRNCPSTPPRPSKARTTETKTTDTEEAPPYEASTSLVSATTTEDKVRTAMALVQQMTDDKKKRYYALDQDFYEADL